MQAWLGEQLERFVPSWLGERDGCAGGHTLLPVLQPCQLCTRLADGCDSTCLAALGREPTLAGRPLVMPSASRPPPKTKKTTYTHTHH